MKNRTVRQFNADKNLFSNLESSFELCDNLNEVFKDIQPSEVELEIDSANVEKTRMECSPEHVCHLPGPCQKILIFENIMAKG